MYEQFTDHILSVLKRKIPAPARKIYKIYNRWIGHLGAASREVDSTATSWDIWPDDVFLVSYPRSGNTWMRYLMTNLRFPEAEWNLLSLAYAFPEIYGPVDPSYVPRPRWIKSHHPYTPSYPKVIYLVRDGRDVSVSFYYWSGYDKKGSFEDFVRDCILTDDTNRFGPWGGWHHHVKDWLAHQHTSNMLVVRYERLVDFPVIELQRVCRFVGLVRSVQDIKIAIERSSFKRMQADFRDHKLFAGKSVGVKGRPGKWREFFDNRLLAEFWQIAGEVSTSVGYEYR